MDNYWFYAIILAVVILATLAFYAAKLLRQLTKQKKLQQQAKLARQQGLPRMIIKCLLVFTLLPVL
jgi:type II secretory pathway component PulJ